MFRKFLVPLFIVLVVLSLSCSEESSTGPVETDLVGQILQAVNIDSLMSYVSHLSGEEPVTYNGQAYTIESRHSNYPGNDIAADYIAQKFTQFGLNPINHNYSAIGRNVTATIQGSAFPNDVYIICAHYDDMPNGPIAPGADDNASGVAAVLEAARILAGYNFDYTVVFALWDEEEQGLIGSRNYAQQALTENRSIKGVINLDMISYEKNNDGVLMVQENVDGAADFICTTLLAVDRDYQLSVVPDTVHQIGGSDHKAFAERGYPAILLIEDYNADWNANYHTPFDVIGEISTTYFHDTSKLAIGTLCRLIEVTGAK